MRRLPLILAAALLVAAPAALAQDAPADPAEDTIVAPGARVVDSETKSSVTTAEPEQLQLTEVQMSGPPLVDTHWTSDTDTTSSRTRGRASSTRVIRACEISLTLDGDCTGR